MLPLKALILFNQGCGFRIAIYELTSYVIGALPLTANVLGIKFDNFFSFLFLFTIPERLSQTPSLHKDSFGQLSIIGKSLYVILVHTSYIPIHTMLRTLDDLSPNC